ncbi:MAG: NAD(P)H-hydrate dehydratase [Lentisphaerae bacterium]|nr:NAD(P)H-hydrate dehydratase [Lentisphaerota bacterium]
MKSADVAAIRQEEKLAIAAGTAEYELMCRAGIQAARYINGKFPDALRVVILAGGGNNGGDALVAASHLRCPEVIVYSTKEKESFTGCAALAVRDLPEKIPFIVRKKLDKFDFASGDVIVDGLLGIGFSGSHLREETANFIRTVNGSGLPVIALDLPSGVNGDTGIAAENGALQCFATLTFGRPKKGLFCNDAVNLRGMLRVIDIGLPDDPNADGEEIFTNLDALTHLPCWEAACHKNSRGRVMVWGSSVEYPGAAALTSLAALKSGCGIVRCVSEADLSGRLCNAAIFKKLAPGEIPENFLNNSDTLVCGCGWGNSVSSAMLEAALNFSGSLVLDADALNFISRNPSLWGGHRQAVITPHPKEAERLMQAFDIPVGSDRRENALHLAEKMGVVVLLKGKDTIAASPEGKYVIISSGNANLATAGSGDVLAGVIGALLARKVPVFEAASLGAYIHGLAGEIAGKIIIADELPDLVSVVLAKLSANEVI